MSYNIGDRVKVTITGTVKKGVNARHTFCHEVQDDHGNTHHVYLTGGSHEGLEIEKLEEPEVFESGQAYQDADGDVFLRSDNNRWIDFKGDFYNDNYATRPLVKLVPAKGGE